MTGRATTQAIAATEPTEGDSDAVRIRHQLDAWANASNRTPRLVATPADDLTVEASGEASLPATKRSRASPATSRAKAAKGTKAARPRTTEAKTARSTTAEANFEPEPPNPAARAADSFHGTHRAGGRFPPRRNAHAPAAPLLYSRHSRWRRLLPIFQSRAWPRYFPVIRLRSWCSPPPWKPASS